MIKVLRDLFGTAPKELPAKKRPSKLPADAQNVMGPYRAVELAPTLMCCAQATRAMGKRILMRDSPSLPFKGCTMPKDCSCKFRKISDRRDGDRRLFGGRDINPWFVNTERRLGMNRRVHAAAR